MKQFIIAIMFFAAALATAAGIEVSVDRDSVPENEPFYFIMEVDGNLENQIQLPPLRNGRWLTNMRQNSTRIINGRASRSIGIGVVGTAAGKLVIPAFPVKVDGEEVMTKELVVEVVPLSEMTVEEAGKTNVRFKEAISGEFTIPDKRPSYYVGEAIPARITVYVLESLHPQLTQLPELIGAASLISRSYTWSDGRSANFEEPSVRPAIHNGRRCLKFEFNTELHPLKAGRYEPKASLTLNIAAPDGEKPRGFGFGFLFDEFNYKPYTLEIPAPEPFEVKPLPTAPIDTINLGLVGEWKLSGGFDRNLAKMGEALTFYLKLEGNGNTDTLITPKLVFENMRVFPAEVQKEKNEVRIRYAVVPLKTGEFQKNFRFATFDTGTGKYAVHELPLKLTVEKGDLPLTQGYSTESGSPVAEKAAPDKPAPSAGNRPAVRHTHRTDPGNGVRLPLLRNAVPAAAGIVVVAGLLALGIELAARRRHRFAHDPEYRRARRLKKETPKLIAKLKAVRTEEEFRRLMADEVHPLLAEALHLPPGATPGEIAARIEDTELRKFLEEEAASGFMPADARKALFCGANIELLVKGLKKFAVLLFLACLAFPAMAEDDPFTRGGEAFAAGNYGTAIEEYRKVLNEQAPSPHVLYNLGEAACRLGDLPLAKGYFERAHRLAPRDPVIAEDLQLVDEQLKLSPAGASRFVQYRDYLRPDHYLLAGSIALAVLMLAAALRRGMPALLARVIVVAAAAIVILSAAAIHFQLNGSYHPDRAIVLGESLELRSLPGDSSGSVVATVPGGSDARILDRNGEFVRISADGQDGWVPAGSVMTLY